MALLDFEQPFQYLVSGDSGASCTNASQGGWSVSLMTTTNAPRAKTAMFKNAAFKVLGGGDGSLAPGDSGAIIGGRYAFLIGNTCGAMGILTTGSAWQFSVSFNSDGTLTVWRGEPAGYMGGTALDTTTFAVSSLRLYYIELDVLLHQTAGWYKLYIDNVLRLDSSVTYPSGVDTCKAAVTTWTSMVACQNLYFQNDNVFVTDIYACDHRDGTTLTPAQVAAYNTPLGDTKVSYLGAVAGNGTYTQWNLTGAADRGEALDDAADGAAMNTTDYVSDNISGHRVSVALDDLDSTNAVILAVAPANSMMKDNSGSKQIKPGHYLSGSPYMGTAVEAPAQGTYRVLREIMTKSPATGVAWTPTEINGAEAIVEIV